MTLDDAYANGKYIPGAADYPPRWAALARGFRDFLGARAQCGLAYGQSSRQRFDLFLPEAEPKGLMVFIHGGYWMAFDRGDWSHLAAGVLARGWACALPGYTLAPDARIAAITGEIGAAVGAAAARVAGPIVLCGHSAGGHLAARMACADAPLPDPVAARVARVIPISPLSDLRPLMQTGMNATLGIDAAEAAAESPALLPMRPGCTVLPWVGAEERPAFLDQARWLAEAWGQRWHVAPGRHHFDVIDDLADPRAPLVEALVG
ncbi:MAG: alpha/beta hydrolase [Paracoccaceae bacterium]